MLPFLTILTVSLLFASALAGGRLVVTPRLRPQTVAAACAICLILGGSGWSASAESAKTASAVVDQPAALAEAPLNTPVQASSTEVVIPPGRPDWVEKPPVEFGPTHTISVCSGPYNKQRDAERELDQLLKRQTDQYIANYLGSPLAPQFIRCELSQIKNELVRPSNVYHEQITVSIGPMQQVHALLEFSPDFRRQIEQRWQQVRAVSRLGQMALFAAGALLFLGTVFGYSRLDSATRGNQTGRLRFLAAAAIMTILAGSVFVAQCIPWF